MAILKDLVVQGRARVVEKTYLSDTEIGGSTTDISSSTTNISGTTINIGGSSSTVTIGSTNSGNVYLGHAIEPTGGTSVTIGVTGNRFYSIYGSCMYSSNGFFQDSDKNKKNIIGEISLERAYELVDKCQEILYTLKSDETKKEQIGLIAQEVKEFFPEIVSGENGDYSLDYARLTVVILRVLKDVINRLSKLENKVK